VRRAQDYYPECPEAFLVSLARTGDRQAFGALVRRRQSPVRNLMRRFCGDPAMADDLAQQVFVKVWLNIRILHIRIAASPLAGL
jgi:DNA-directed RNA polymerase specialized sigma24 family protein